MPEAFPNDPGEKLPTGWKALSKHKLFVPCSLEGDVVADQRKNSFTIGFGWVIKVFVEDG